MASPVRALSGPDEWADALSNLGGLVLTLHRLAASVPAAEFQHQALVASQTALGFDSAVWAAGVLGPGPILHTVHTYRQPAEMITDWQRIIHHDDLFFEGIKRPGETLRATADGPEGCPPFAPEVAAHCRRYRMEHVLGTVYTDPTLGLIEGIAFYRADAGRPFSEPDRLLTQNLVPHLAETWRLNRLRSVHPEKRSIVVSRMALAVCDRKGLLHTAGPGFATMMRSEWPDWQGPFVAAELIGAGHKPYLGRRIGIWIEPLNDLWLVKVRKRSSLDSLSRREREVASHFGQGMSYQDIAQALHLAPATVRNHLKNIYAKLGIGSKVELIRLLG